MPDDAVAVLVSLRPEFARAIAAGDKTVELRRRFPDLVPGTWLVIYVTKPVGAVVGMVRVEAVVRAPVADLWKQVGDHAGVSRETFFGYFAGCEEGCGVYLGERRSVGPLFPDDMHAIIPGFRPPQSYRYVQHAGLAALHDSSTTESHGSVWRT